MPLRPMGATWCSEVGVQVVEGEMTRTGHKKLATDLFESFADGNIEAVLALLDPAVEWELVGPHDIPYFGRYVGTAQVRRFFERLRATIEVLSFEVDSITSRAPGRAGRCRGRP
jgi:ketosteroid isomerase-like protein